MREYVVPLDDDVPYWGFNEKFMMMRARAESTDKLTGTEYGDNYTAHWVTEVTGNALITTWISGDVVCTLTFKKMEE